MLVITETMSRACSVLVVPSHVLLDEGVSCSRVNNESLTVIAYHISFKNNDCDDGAVYKEDIK